ncbi:MAG: hypothetical protein CM15mP74_24900 [Halieaceae bacterium]|nr:MAG: hypothetical protein CM15mP74_24900 [Halieaceae bacterium]
MTSTFHPPLRTLMGPGPSDVSPRVLAASARPTIGHLDPLFVGLMDHVKRLLQFTFQTKNELTIPLSAPGSAGMEAAFVNLLEPGDKAIVCQKRCLWRTHEGERGALRWHRCHGSGPLGGSGRP